MAKGLIVIVDLGHENSEMIKKDVEDLGVKAVICQHDVSHEELEGLGEISGFILNGGPCKCVRGFRVDASEEIYESNLPTFSVDHASFAGVDLFTWPKDETERREKIKKFIDEKCKIET